MIHILLNSFEYVSQAPNFYGSMGVVSALGMFVGALIYKGQIEAVLKAVLVVASYAILLVWVNLSRVLNTVPLFPKACTSPPGAARSVHSP